MQLNKTITLIIVLITFFLVVSGCVKKPVSVQQPINVASTTTATTTGTTIVEIDTSEWKTYKNEEYGFEFKYPDQINDREYRLSARNKDEDWFIDKSIYVVQFWPLGWQDYMLRVEVVNKKDGRMIDEYMEKIKANQNINFIKKELSVNNTNALIMEDSYAIKTDSGTYVHKAIHAHFFGDKFDYYVSAGTTGGDSNCATCYWVIEETIKSFRLVD